MCLQATHPDAPPWGALLSRGGTAQWQVFSLGDSKNPTRVKITEELLGERAGPGGDGRDGPRIWRRNERAKVSECLGGGVRDFLPRGGVKVRGCQLAEFIEHCLCGTVVADFHANAVGFKEGEEAGKVTGTDEGGEGVRVRDRLELVKLRHVDRGPGHGDGWCKLFDKCRLVDEEVEVAAALCEEGCGVGGDNRTHRGGHTPLRLLGWGRVGVGGGIGGIGCCIGFWCQVESCGLDGGRGRGHIGDGGGEFEDKGSGLETKGGEAGVEC